MYLFECMSNELSCEGIMVIQVVHCADMVEVNKFGA